MDYQLTQTGAQVQEILDDAPITQQDLEAVEALLPEDVSTGNKLVDYNQMNTLLQAKQDKLTEQTTGTKVGDLSVKYGVNIGYGITVGSDNQTKVSITPGSITKGQGANIFDALATIEAVIPSAASGQNKLTDKNYVDSAIATSSANFVGTFESLAELQAVQNPTNNDYGFVIETDAQGNEYYDRYKFNGTQWLFEYKVESTPFTADQWAAIQSGITSALVTKLNALPTAQQLNSQLAGKQDTISDLAAIRTGAAAGATAVQPAALQSGLAGKQDTITDLAAIRSGAAAGATAAANTGDKAYDAAAFSGLGRKNLPKNITTVGGTEKNVLTQAMVNTANTIYVIQYDYDLNGQTITMPAGCVLQFEGGSIKNGTITGNDTDIVADGNVQIFDGVAFGGSFIIEKVSVKWFGAKGDRASADTKPIQEALDFVCDANVSKICYIPNGVYLLPPAGAISEGSPYNYHLWLKDSITIVGEDRFNTILKRVLPDLSEPTQEAYAVKVETGAMIYYITTNTTDVNAVFSVQNLTLDGNENWYHYNFAYYRNTLISTVSGGNRLRNNVFKNLICKNTCDEGIHLEAIDWYTTSICEKCDFYNIGGGGGNLAGGHTSYIDCNFERTFLEFGWYSSVVPSDTDAYLKVERCTFKNRAGNLLSADYQGNMTGYSTARKYLFVNNCTFTNTDDFRAETDAITEGNVNIKGMRSIYFGNLEECHITGCKFINGAYRIGRGGNVIYAKENYYSEKAYIKNNYIFQTCDGTKINTQYVKYCDIRENEIFASNGKDVNFLPNNNSGNVHSTYSLLTANANYVFTYYNKADVNMLAVVEIVNLSGAAANVTIRQRGVSSATRASVNKSFPTGISYEYFAFTTETSNSFLATTAASDVYFSVKIAEQNIVPSISGVNIANNYKGLIVNSVGVLSHYDGTNNVDAFGYPAVRRKGTTAQRPTLTSDDAGFQYYDTTIGKTITWDGSTWGTGGGDSNAVTKTSADDINVWTDKSVVVGWFNADGSIGSGTSNITAFIPVMANGTYLLTSAFHSQGGREYDANKQLLRAATYSSSTKQFTIGENTAYIRFGFQTSATQEQIDVATLKSVGGYAIESDVRVLYLENLLSALSDRVSALENA